MFQLDAEINKWCDSLELQGMERESAIDELKDHLHREIKKQQVLGLGKEAAFKVAIEKMGDTELLKTEYQKVQNGNFFGQVVTGLSTDAIRLSETGDIIALESSLRVPFKTLLFGLGMITLALGIGMAGILATSQSVYYVFLLFVVCQLTYVLFEHWRGRTFIEITPNIIRQQFRLGPFTLIDNIFATEFISELESRRMLPGFKFGVCRVQFKYGSRMRAFNVGYYEDEAHYIINQIRKVVPQQESNAASLAVDNRRSRLSNFIFALSAIVPPPAYWGLYRGINDFQNFYDRRPELSVPATTELLFTIQPYFLWLCVFSLLCVVPYLMIVTGKIRGGVMKEGIERLIVINAFVCQATLFAYFVIAISPRLLQ